MILRRSRARSAPPLISLTASSSSPPRFPHRLGPRHPGQQLLHRHRASPSSPSSPPTTSSRTFAPNRASSTAFSPPSSLPAIAAKGSTLSLWAPMIAITLILLAQTIPPPRHRRRSHPPPLDRPPNHPHRLPTLPLSDALPASPSDQCMPISNESHRLSLRSPQLPRWLSYDDTRGRDWFPTWLHARLLPRRQSLQMPPPRAHRPPANSRRAFRRRLERPSPHCVRGSASSSLQSAGTFPPLTRATPPSSSSSLIAAPLAALLTRRPAIITAAILATPSLPPAPSGSLPRPPAFFPSRRRPAKLKPSPPPPASPSTCPVPGPAPPSKTASGTPPPRRPNERTYAGRSGNFARLRLRHPPAFARRFYAHKCTE